MTRPSARRPRMSGEKTKTAPARQVAKRLSSPHDRRSRPTIAVDRSMTDDALGERPEAPPRRRTADRGPLARPASEKRDGHPFLRRRRSLDLGLRILESPRLGRARSAPKPSTPSSRRAGRLKALPGPTPLCAFEPRERGSVRWAEAGSTPTVAAEVDGVAEATAGKRARNRSRGDETEARDDELGPALRVMGSVRSTLFDLTLQRGLTRRPRAIISLAEGRRGRG